MIIIKEAKVKDIKGIQEVFYKTWLETYPNKKAGITVEDVEAKYKDRFSEQVISKRKAAIFDKSGKSLFLVAKDKNLVVGVCRLKKEELYNELGAIYVLPDYQRQGIGRLFWEKAIIFFHEKFAFQEAAKKHENHESRHAAYRGGGINQKK